MSRSATVRVSCRIRSASVDLPWSMWAMIEKLRIVSSDTLVAYFAPCSRGPASHPAGERGQHLHVGELEDAARGPVGAAAGGEGEPDRDDLRRQRAAEELVERPPDAERGGGAVDGRDHDPDALAEDLGHVQVADPAAQEDEQHAGVPARDDGRR